MKRTLSLTVLTLTLLAASLGLQQVTHADEDLDSDHTRTAKGPDFWEYLFENLPAPPDLDDGLPEHIPEHHGIPGFEFPDHIPEHHKPE
ncbi:hypothetical protein [Alteribacter populi]|uniref:hypothetical protein n=1 Tax=Alteribacter populi TaxID=2011011 RepID=UPI000BBA58CC|nr:hypothetical protein [Alteribacter populi]